MAGAAAESRGGGEFEITSGPRIGVDYAGDGLGRSAVALLDRRPPVGVETAMTDARSQELLEFPLIRARLAGHTAFAPSRRLAEALTPSSDPVVVKRMLDETDQARDLLSRRPDVGVGGAHDIGQIVLRAAARRPPRRQRSCSRSWTRSSPRAGSATRCATSGRRCSTSWAARSSRCRVLRDRLEQSLDPAGELLDGASPALGGLRRAVRVAYERLRTRLETIVHSSDFGAALQEPIVTLRNGRYVVPVRADARGRVKGIVHDQSGSGQTLFIEPLVVVELGNTWREAQLTAQAEEERILDELSGARRSPGRCARRDARRAGHVRLLDRPSATGGRDGRGPAGNGRARRRRAAHRRATRV